MKIAFQLLTNACHLCAITLVAMFLFSLASEDWIGPENYQISNIPPAFHTHCWTKNLEINQQKFETIYLFMHLSRVKVFWHLRHHCYLSLSSHVGFWSGFILSCALSRLIRPLKFWRVNFQNQSRRSKNKLTTHDL